MKCILSKTYVFQGILRMVKTHLAVQAGEPIMLYKGLSTGLTCEARKALHCRDL